MEVFHIWRIRKIDGEEFEGRILYKGDGLFILQRDPLGLHEKVEVFPFYELAYFEDAGFVGVIEL